MGDSRARPADTSERGATVNDAVPAILVGAVLIGFGGWMLVENLRGKRHPGALFSVVPIPASFWFPGLLVAGGLLFAGLPFQATSDPAPTSVSTAVSKPASTVPTQTPAPVATPWAPYWVKNHEIAEMWSGPVGQDGVISFGKTSAQFCSFQVLQPQGNDRLYVLNPHSKNYFWIDARSIGPAPPPERRSGPPPPDVNCSDGVCD